MKLQNKVTGEIKELHEILSDMIDNHIVPTLIVVENEWQDYEEPKEYWYIDDAGVIQIDQVLCCEINMRKSIGNYFATREEAEKAVEKLKAWKRLKDKGFKFDHIRSIDGSTMKHKELDQYTIIAYADEDGCDRKSLDLLFGGEE